VLRPSVVGNGRDVALMTPTLTVCAQAERVADGHHPVSRLHLRRIAELHSGSVWFGFSVSSISALSVSGSRPTTFAAYS
jgi:hypothetical protein